MPACSGAEPVTVPKNPTKRNAYAFGSKARPSALDSLRANCYLGFEMTQPADQPAISFIIPVFDCLDLTRNCLKSLEQTVQSHSWEAIIVDDCSTDGTAEFLATLPEPYRIIRNETKQNYSVNNNRAAAIARGKFLCLLNNDTVLLPGWLDPMLDAFKRFPDAGVVGNVQWNPRTKLYDHMGHVFSDEALPTHYGKAFWFRHHRAYSQRRSLTAACCLVRRSLFLEVGGFDEGFINGFEDVDLCLRLGQRGYRHYVANHSVIHHLVSSSDGRSDFNEPNTRRFMERWAPIVAPLLTPAEKRLYAWNYIRLRLTEPWRYNGPKLARALARLAFLRR